MVSYGKRGFPDSSRFQGFIHTPSIAFRHPPPNSARFSYATVGALFISAQVSMQRRGQRPPKGSGTNMTVEAT